MARVLLLFVTTTMWLSQISPTSSWLLSVSENSYPLPAMVNKAFFVSSPNYNGSYGNNLNCGRAINALIGYVVKLYVDDAKMEEGHDYVQLFDGSSEASPSLAKFSSMPSPRTFYSSGRSMYIKFFTDKAVALSGFCVSYTLIPRLSVPTSVCSDPRTLLVDNKQIGYLTSPNYPDSYGNNINCRRVLAAPAGYVIKLDIWVLKLDGNNDYVDLLDGVLDSSPRLGRFYALPNQTVYFSSGQNMSINFHTDGSVTNSGFKMEFKTWPASARG